MPWRFRRTKTNRPLSHEMREWRLRPPPMNIQITNPLGLCTPAAAAAVQCLAAAPPSPAAALSVSFLPMPFSYEEYSSKDEPSAPIAMASTEQSNFRQDIALAVVHRRLTACLLNIPFCWLPPGYPVLWYAALAAAVWMETVDIHHPALLAVPAARYGYCTDFSISGWKYT